MPISLSPWRTTLSFTVTDLMWHAAGLVICLLAGSLLGWYSYGFWIVGAESYGMVGLVVMSYLGSVLFSRRVLNFAKTDLVATTFFSLLLCFFLTSAVLVMSRWYFSRTYLLGAFLAAFLWQVLQLWLQQPRRYRLALVPGGLADELPVLGGADWQVLEAPHHIPAQAVVMDPHHTAEPRWLRFVAEQSLRGIPLLHAAVVYEGLTGRVSLEHHSEALLESWSSPGFYPYIKRFFDIIVVVLTSPISLPLMLLVSLAIRLDSRGSVFFVQPRMGEGGHSFNIVKFRTMREDDDTKEAKYAVEGDNRITKVGHFLRKSRLNELPQIWNILRGEMSLVGPRPEMLSFAEDYAKEIPLYPYRHLVKPGLTGWAQINQGYADAEATAIKLSYDLYYVKHLSFWLDILIVLKTIRTLLTGFGAR